jgi:hypothetical protein
MREFPVTEISRRRFVTDKDGFPQLRVDLAAVSRKTGQRLVGTNLSFDTVADYVFQMVESRLKASGCTLTAGILAGPGSIFLFTGEEMENLGLTSKN